MAEFNERKWSLGEIVKASEGIVTPDRMELLEMALLLDSVHNEERELRDWRLSVGSSMLRNRQRYFDAEKTENEIGRARHYVEFSASQYLGVIKGKDVIDELDKNLRTASACVFMMNYDQSDRHPFMGSLGGYKVDMEDLWGAVRQLHGKTNAGEWSSDFELQDMAEFLLLPEFQGLSYGERLDIPLFDDTQYLLDQQEFTKRTRRPY